MSIVGKETTNPFVEVALKAVRAAMSGNDEAYKATRRQAYRNVFGSADGQIVLADILGQGGLFASSGALEKSAGTGTEPLAVASGRRDLALHILQQLYPEATLAKRARQTK